MTATLEPTTTPQAGKPATATAVDVIRKARDAGVQVVDLRFTDLPGTWQHFSIPLKELTEDLFKEGIGFDGSSIRGFQAINESDMLLFADPASAFVDPCLEVPTLSLTCDVSDPVTGARYSRDPRYVAQKAEQYLVQTGIDMRFTTLARMADQLMMYKYIVKNVCHQHGYTATFMPKPMFGDNGSGMHVHMSLWKDGSNLFFDAKGYALLSDAARWYIGGLIKHAAALLAFAAPTTNSYRRLVPGYEAPINLIYSQRNRSAICRIPVYSKSPKAKRVEFRAPDPSSNPYLCFAALLLAGLDGVKNKIEPPKPMDVDLYELEPEERKHVKNTPGSLPESLAALEADHDFLLQGDVFTADVIETWLAYKRAKEVDPVALRPHPYEFFLYYDV